MLLIKNSKDLVSPSDLKLKILITGFHGVGKTTFMSTFPKVLAGVCETGHGKGLLSVATKGIDYTELTSYNQFEEFCQNPPQSYDSFGLDSLQEMVKTFIKEKTLSLPRAKGDSQKRLMGVPEIDDYGVMGELTRKLTKRLIDQPKHICVIGGLRIDKPDPENGQGEMLIGPDLPGQMFLGSTAMFDLVLCLRTRSVLRDPKDAKSRYTERFFITENTGSGIIAKNRLSIEEGISFLPTELIFDPKRGLGTFNDILTRAQTAYTQWLDAKKAGVKAA